MKRISANNKTVKNVESALKQIEKQQEHDADKVRKSISNLKEHGGVDLHLADHFEIKNIGGKGYVSSPGGANLMLIGETKPSLKAGMYIVGREPNSNAELVYYKVTGSGIQKRDCGKSADSTVSRFDLAIIPQGDRVQIFNIGRNKTDLYFEGEVEF